MGGAPDDHRPVRPIGTSAAGEALAAYRDAWYAGEYIDPGAFAAGFPDCAAELLGRIRCFLMVAERSDDARRLWSAQSREPGQRSGTAPGTRIHGFEILGEIGSGGTGAVYEALQVAPKRRVALKILPPLPAFSIEAAKKLQREAEAGGWKAHPGIAAVYSADQHDGTRYLAEELVEGGRTLADRLEALRGKKALPPGHFEEMARLSVEVAEALQSAHEAGVIHCGVKPSNILLTLENRPKVTDFGIAAIEDALELARTGVFAGTPYYLSPEQAARQSHGLDHRTDIFSLGATLYEMLTLVRPFDGVTSHQVLKKILLREPADPRAVQARVPRDLAVIALKALAKKPESRYATMKDMAADLRRYLAGEAIAVRPASIGRMLIERARRNPLRSAAVAAVLAVLLLAVAGIPWVIAAKERQKRVAAEARQAVMEAQRNAEK